MYPVAVPGVLLFEKNGGPIELVIAVDNDPVDISVTVTFLSVQQDGGNARVFVTTYQNKMHFPWARPSCLTHDSSWCVA
jgi:hypothetical protein